MGAYFLFKERSVDLLLSLTQRKKQRNIRPTKASPQGEDATDYGGKPPCVRILVWLTKPVPLRGEPWSFYRLAQGGMMEEGMRRKKKNAQKVARFKRIMYLCSGFRRKEEIMCTCIAEIKASYTKVRHQTAEVAQQQFDIDDYLDKVIVVRKKLEQITEETNSLVETVRDHFTEFDVQETTELLAHSTPILILMDQLHQKLVESPLYPGLKTAVENYCDCVSIFQELCSDLQTFNIDIPRNEKSREVEELLRKLA